MFLPGDKISGISLALSEGRYYDVLKEFSEKSSKEISTVENALREYISLAKDTGADHLILIGVAALSLFVQLEWTGPSAQPDVSTFIADLKSRWPTEDVAKSLVADSDDVIPTTCPHLLLLARMALEESAKTQPDSTLSKVWYLRALFIQQQILEESSPLLHQKIIELIDSLDPLISEQEERIYFLLEAARIHLFYGFVEKCQVAIEKAAALAKLKYAFTGVLGKRTRYQENELAQLVMNIDVGKVSNPDAGQKITHEPKILPLNDDVRLEKVKYSEEVKEARLSNQHVAILLAVLMVRRKSMPEDELTIEESKTIVDKVLGAQCSWSLRLSSLLLRSHLERSARRTVERAMLQVQSVLDDIQNEQPMAPSRLEDFFVSHLPSKRGVETTLADFQMSLGAFKSALEICLRLKHWEMAVVCYNMLQLRHKAQELIEEELKKGETPKLWCLLGDATDDTTCYEKAWDLSKEKSARAQRHWANHLYARKKYGESIEHFEKSLEINSLQSDLWFRLGFAALHEEQWELGAKAYRRYSTLEPDCFEAWNNLARCYCEMKQTQRAWRALKEALKVDANNWRVWDNYMLVSAQEKQFSEVIRSYNELLNIKKDNHVDMQALVALVGGYFTCEDVSQRKTLKQPILKLLDRLTTKPTKHGAEIWTLCADIHSVTESEEDRGKEFECLLQAHTSAVNVSGWDNEMDSCKRVVGILERLSDFAVEKPELKEMFLLVARPSVGTLRRKYPDLEICNNISSVIERLSAGA